MRDIPLTFDQNLLPRDGTVIYFGKVIPETKAKSYLGQLMNNIEWKQDEVIIFGRHIITKRKSAWYSDNNLSYKYSGMTKFGLNWTPELLEIKSIVEKITQNKFNSCLLNLYHNGDEGMSWHSDNEKSLGKNPIIASVSFGAERKFILKHSLTKEKVSVQLENGSLLLMKDETQRHWLHSLPKSKNVSGHRINLTFRTIAS